DGLGEFWLNPDEGIYYSAVTLESWEGIKQELIGNAHPPLFYLLLRAMGVFGTDFLWLRIPSLIFGCLAIHGMYLAGKAYAGTLAGLVGALFMALMPSAILQSQIIRPYMILLAFVLYSLTYLGRYLGGGSRRNLYGYAGFFLLAILTHYSAFLVLGILGISLGVMTLSKQLEKQQVRDLLIASSLPAVAVVLLYFLHIRPSLQGSDLQAQALDTWMSSFMIADGEQAWQGTQGLMRYLFGFRQAGTVFLILVVGLFFAIDRKRSQLYTMPLAAFAVALLFSFMGQYPFGDSRHSLYLVPFLILPMAFGISQVFSMGRVPAAIAGLVLACLFALPVIGNFIMVGGPQRVRFLDERLSTTAGFREKVEPQVTALRDKAGMMILNVQSYYLLLPLLLEMRDSEVWHAPYAGSPDGYRTGRFGECQVVISKDWDMSAGLDRNAGPESLAGLMRNVDALSPDLKIREQGSAWIMIGGWDMPLADGLLRINRDAGGKLIKKAFMLEDRSPIAGSVQTNPRSFVGFEVDLTVYDGLLGG
ncbi:MAG: glycosyltransferase family 39 protein, partial [Planctomycetota bacterium]